MRFIYLPDTQVDEITDMMRGNLTKIMEREEKLEDLEKKADKLEIDAQQFQASIHIMNCSFILQFLLG